MGGLHLKIYDMATVELLPEEDICLVKKINLGNNYLSGVVCYTRNLSENCSMNSHVDNKNNCQDEKWPPDMLDETILKAIKEKYPKAICFTELQVSKNRLEQNKRWIEQCSKSEVNLCVLEDVEEMSPCCNYPVKYLKRCFEVKIYKFNLNPNAQRDDEFFTCHVETAEYDELERLRSSLGQLE